MLRPDQAVIKAYKQSFNFKGRASLSEYWWFYLYFVVLVLLLQPIVSSLESTDEHSDKTIVTMVAIVFIAYCLFLIFTSITLAAVSVRRLHDADFSGWWALIAAIPLLLSPIAIAYETLAVGFYVLSLACGAWDIGMHVRDGTEGANRFGPPTSISGDTGDIVAEAGDADISSTSSQTFDGQHAASAQQEQPSTAPLNSAAKYELLEKLSKIYKEGILSEEEFLAEKRRILNG